MEGEYNFWADLLSTFRSLNDWIKALIVVMPWATLLVYFAVKAWKWKEPADSEHSAESDSETPLPVGTGQSNLRVFDEVSSVRSTE